MCWNRGGICIIDLGMDAPDNTPSPQSPGDPHSPSLVTLHHIGRQMRDLCQFDYLAFSTVARFWLEPVFAGLALPDRQTTGLDGAGTEPVFRWAERDLVFAPDDLRGWWPGLAVDWPQSILEKRKKSTTVKVTLRQEGTQSTYLQTSPKSKKTVIAIITSISIMWYCTYSLKRHYIASS